jgi:hypothetical protein
MARCATLAAATAAAALAAGASALQLVPQPLGGIPLPTPQQLAYAGGISALVCLNMATYFHDVSSGRPRVRGWRTAPVQGCAT